MDLKSTIMVEKVKYIAKFDVLPHKGTLVLKCSVLPGTLNAKSHHQKES